MENSNPIPNSKKEGMLDDKKKAELLKRIDEWIEIGKGNLYYSAGMQISKEVGDRVAKVNQNLIKELRRLRPLVEQGMAFVDPPVNNDVEKLIDEAINRK